jgi:hypothetical protein
MAGGWGVTIPLGPPNRAVDHWSTAWADVSGSRAIGTTYVGGNTARRVSAIISSNSADVQELQQQLPGGAWLAAGPRTPPSGGTSKSVVGMVSPGANYRIAQVVGSSATLTSWWEADL